eukprot:15366065-Ditylum_brightwellii.AAC.1
MTLIKIGMVEAQRSRQKCFPICVGSNEKCQVLVAMTTALGYEDSKYAFKICIDDNNVKKVTFSLPQSTM